MENTSLTPGLSQAWIIPGQPVSETPLPLQQGTIQQIQSTDPLGAVAGNQVSAIAISASPVVSPGSTPSFVPPIATETSLPTPPPSPLGRIKRSLGLVLVLIAVGWTPLWCYILFTKDAEPEISEPAPLALSSAPEIPENDSGSWLTEWSGSVTQEEALVVPAEEKIPDIHKVFKLKAYSKTEDGGYSYESYGSAILVGDNQILTNAHVIMGQDDLPTGKYNLCLTNIDSEEQPVCVTWLKLIKYDTLKDIALLQPTKKVYLGTPIELKSRKLTLWETIKVFGYPGNGWSTLSFTEWKMSGTEKEYYKMDANIDHGNSWGGAFDKDDVFVGMPFIAQRWLTTMGYIIPVTMIQDFLQGKGDIVSYSQDESGFNDYISRLNSAIINQKISNPFFTFDSFNEAGFTLREISWNPEDGFASYVLTSKTENTIITISTPYLKGNVYYPYNDSDEDLSKQFEIVKAKYDVYVGNKKVDLEQVVVGQKKENGTIDNNIALHAYEIKWVRYSVLSKANNVEKKDYESGIDLFTKHFSITSTPLMQSGDKIEFYSGSFTLPGWTYAARNCSDTCEYVIVVDSDIRINVTISEISIDSEDKDTMVDIMNSAGSSMMDNLDEYWWTGQVALFKSTPWNAFVHSSITWGDNSVNMAASFYGKISKDKVIRYSFKAFADKPNTLLKTAFEKIIFSVDINLPVAFPEK